MSSGMYQNGSEHIWAPPTGIQSRHNPPLFNDGGVSKSMDSELRLKVSEKIQETIMRGAEIRAIANRLSPDAADCFVNGMIAGRLHNSFHYQCRRIKKRDPEPREVEEFLEMIAGEWHRVVEACRRQ